MTSIFMASPAPDAHGQAALLLAESILHALIEHSVFSIPEAVVVVRTAAEVKAEVAGRSGESEWGMQEPLDLLARIARSLETDDH